MRNIEAIYQSKLERFEAILEQKSAKHTLFADILSKVQTQTDEQKAVQAPPDAYDASLHTGYAGTSTVGSSEIDSAVENAARATGLSPALIRAVIMTESSFRPKAVSRCGAQGLMQLMPGTARELGVTDSFDVYQNVMGGSTYLKKQLDRFGDLRLALAAYNTGPSRVAKYNITDANDPAQYERLSAGVRGYVSKVLRYYEQYAGI